eukprot:comp74135_c0_seq1/m.48212 comp74135_c0_seq1/g.48212  ORF comp74135_c0_seq1/g.48212 comp74135_c0_seq1/m.48212 type:complete len:168 (-) comp74135_c0_seq1:60-563(-)
MSASKRLFTATTLSNLRQGSNLISLMTPEQRMLVEGWAAEHGHKAFGINDNGNMLSCAFLHPVQANPLKGFLENAPRVPGLSVELCSPKSGLREHKKPFVLDFIFTHPQHLRKGLARDLLEGLKEQGFDMSAFCEDYRSEKVFLAAKFRAVARTNMYGNKFLLAQYP